MLTSHLHWLACPRCGSDVSIEYGKGRVVQEAVLRCRERHRGVVKRGVPRFISDQDIGKEAALAFASELDSAHAGRYWHDRFAAITGFPIELLAGKTVLELGGGAGKFTEWIARHAAHVVSVEPSAKVEAARQTVGDLSNVTVVQGRLERPPVKGTYDVVLLLGGLMAAERPGEVLRAAERLTKRGGMIYLWLPRKQLGIPTLYGIRRRLLRPLPVEALYEVGMAYADVRTRLSRLQWLRRWAGWNEEHRPAPAQIAAQFVDSVISRGPIQLKEDKLEKWARGLLVEGKTPEGVALRKRVFEIAGTPRRPVRRRGRQERQAVAVG